MLFLSAVIVAGLMKGSNWVYREQLEPLLAPSPRPTFLNRRDGRHVRVNGRRAYDPHLFGS